MRYEPERFSELVKEFAQGESVILAHKGKEYTGNEDRLQNFRDVANFFGDEPVVITPSIVALIYLLKHLQSIKLTLTPDETPKKWCWTTDSGFEGLKQRFADARNYLLLLAACIDETDGKEGGGDGSVQTTAY